MDFDADVIPSSSQQPENLAEPNPSDDSFYTEQQPGVDADMDALHMAVESIPDIQAQINQVTIMLNNPTLSMPVRQQTEMKHAQLQMELQQAQMAAALIQAGNVAAMSAMNMNTMNNMNNMNGNACARTWWYVWCTRSGWRDGCSGYDGPWSTTASRSMRHESILKPTTHGARFGLPEVAVEQLKKESEAGEAVRLLGGSWRGRSGSQGPKVLGVTSMQVRKSMTVTGFCLV